MNQSKKRISFFQFKWEEILCFITFIVLIIFKKNTSILRDNLDVVTMMNLNISDLMYLIPLGIILMYIFNLIPNLDVKQAKEYAIIHGCILGIQFLCIWGYSSTTSQHYNYLSLIGNVVLSAIHCAAVYLVLWRVRVEVYNEAQLNEDISDLYE